MNRQAAISKGHGKMVRGLAVGRRGIFLGLGLAVGLLANLLTPVPECIPWFPYFCSTPKGIELASFRDGETSKEPKKRGFKWEAEQLHDYSSSQ